MRQDHGWTQAHLAEAAGIGERTVQRAEGETPAKEETLQAIAGAFDVSLSALKTAPEHAIRLQSLAQLVNTSPKRVTLEPINQGSDFLRYLRAFGVHVEPDSALDTRQQEAAIRLEVLLGDCVDVWNDGSAASRIEALRRLRTAVDDLKALDLAIAAGFYQVVLRVPNKVPLFATHSYIVVSRATAPKRLLRVARTGARPQLL
jgi:transcriptional regulator with XRE-family HTH domain